MSNEGASNGAALRGQHLAGVVRVSHVRCISNLEGNQVLSGPLRLTLKRGADITYLS